MQSLLKSSTKTKPNLMKYNVTKRKRQKNETKCNAFRQLVQKVGVNRERKKTNKIRNSVEFSSSTLCWLMCVAVQAFVIIMVNNNIFDISAQNVCFDMMVHGGVGCGGGDDDDDVQV